MTMKLQGEQPLPTGPGLTLLCSLARAAQKVNSLGGAEESNAKFTGMAIDRRGNLG